MPRSGMSTVEELLGLIARATDERYIDSPDHCADTEYGVDMLNELLLGLGDFVAGLPRDYNVAWPADNRELIPRAFDEGREVWVPGVVRQLLPGGMAVVTTKCPTAAISTAQYNVSDLQMR